MHDLQLMCTASEYSLCFLAVCVCFVCACADQTTHTCCAMPAAFTFLLFDCGQSGRQIAMQIIKKVLQKFASFKSTAKEENNNAKRMMRLPVRERSMMLETVCAKNKLKMIFQFICATN